MKFPECDILECKKQHRYLLEVFDKEAEVGEKLRQQFRLCEPHYSKMVEWFQ